MTSKPEILHMEQRERALGELCWITPNTFERKRLLKALGHHLRLLHTVTGKQFCMLCTRQLRKAKICIFQALLRIPNKPQNRSGGQRLRTPQQSRLLSWLSLRVPSGNWWFLFVHVTSREPQCTLPGRRSLEPAVLTGSCWKQMALTTEQTSS